MALSYYSTLLLISCFCFSIATGNKTVDTTTINTTTNMPTVTTTDIATTTQIAMLETESNNTSRNASDSIPAARNIINFPESTNHGISIYYGMVFWVSMFWYGLAITL